MSKQVINEFRINFLAQTYRDAWDDYQRTLSSRKAVLWDYVVLTAADDKQADVFRSEIKARIDGGYLPEKTQYIVVPDPDGKRVGSGGATLNVLRVLMERDGDFDSKRCLVVHSGGDSKRIPQYSVCGKLFSPVPRELPDGRPSTLFDEIIITVSAMAGRITEGMLVLSGDVLILFNPLQVDAQLNGAAAVSVKTDPDVGSMHGVFLSDNEGKIIKFLHKERVESLHSQGAVDARGKVDIDTGAILLDRDIVNALSSLISDTSEDGRVINKDKFGAFVNERSRISFYGDFLYPLAKDARLDEYYKQAPEGEFCDELTDCRTQIWQALSKFSFTLFPVLPAEFLHFGTSRELLELVTEEVASYRPLGWTRQVNSVCPNNDTAAYHSIVEEGAVVPRDSYVEYSHIHSGVKIGHRSIVSGVDILEGEIPDDTVVHGVVLSDGRFVARVFGVDVNPKETISYEGREVSIWEAPLFPVKNTMNEAVLASVRAMRGENTDVSGEKISLKESFILADHIALVDYHGKLSNRILFARIRKSFDMNEPETVIKALFDRQALSKKLLTYLIDSAADLEFSDKMRMYHLLSSVMEEKGMKTDEHDAETVADLCYGVINTAITSNVMKRIPDMREHSFASDEAKINLPVRVNWGGGWTDTPPICMERGGVVINAAITLNGKYPIHAVARRLDKPEILFESSDLGVSGRAASVEDIRNCRNPGDFFALHKAALLATGIIPMIGDESLEDICKRLGGGLYLCTSVDGIPKGSGLGTSSILAAAAVKALFSLLGISPDVNDTIGVVLTLEQLMSTGGGWQDQAGALAPGIKRLSSRPGADQQIQVDTLEIPDDVKKEISERFVLIYTGQRRLARNLLRDVIGSYISGRKETVEALYEMKMLVEDMQYALMNNKFDKFAQILNRHWEVSKKLDGGCTNTCIESIFDACEDLIAGRFIAGAGGGGFLQVILNKGVSSRELSDRIETVFGDSGVSVWKPDIVWE